MKSCLYCVETTMLTSLEEWYVMISSNEFWLRVMTDYRGFGPLAPIFLAMLESFIPALPLIAIVTFSIGAYGPFLGFIYSYIGSLGGSILVFLFFRRIIKPHFMHLVPQRKNLQKLMDWVSRQTSSTIFMLASFPFTPSSLLNTTFGLSDFKETTYIKAIAYGKLIMITLLAVFGTSLVGAFENPLYFILVIAFFIVIRYIYGIFQKKTGLNELEKKKKEDRGPL
ncbi:MAG: TVP38/TMEM64 family protein [Erysipelotrichales bacterium]|nr:MAG: TVP38/TMEM64 family protein [Erysipelotrichales bacterium]